MREVVKRNLRVEPKGVNLSDALKQLRYFWLSMAALLLSACFPAAELQLIVLSVIAGAKWIASGSSRKINIRIS
ncbi:MAG: hypothetical protein HQ547_04855 [Candidatus Omnitrophica bacterium]|nr:hypothetical protein [Candidatus Omnitrophota bacterium]